MSGPVRALLIAASLIAAGCSDAPTSSAPVIQPASVTQASATVVLVTTAPLDSQPSGSAPSDTARPEDPAPADPAPAASLLVGASSRSVLPTMNDSRDYLVDAPGTIGADPYDPGVFIPMFDQGQIDVGNGNSDAAWVHDDIRATAVAVQTPDALVVFVSVDVYMIFAADAAEIERRARKNLPEAVRETAHIIISATHNHHGPDTAFSVNDAWYELMADETAATIGEAVSFLQPATLRVASGEHRFGVNDARDPVILDPALNVLTATAETGDVIATIVQWASHPETTLGYEPKDDYDISAACSAKGWQGQDCYADGRYLTADYPGVMRDVIRTQIGGEVLYYNGAIGSQIGPGHADVWLVDAAHPVGNGFTPPADARPVPGATDFRDQTFARTQAIGQQLGDRVLQLMQQSKPVDVTQLLWREQAFYTRLTNIGFRVLLADGDLGWQTPTAYICSMPLGDTTCVSDNNAAVDDPVLTPLTGSQVRVGDVLKTRLVHVSLGDVGFLFMPGELPPELVIGLPANFLTANDRFYRDPTEVHARGTDYAIPGYLLSLVDETTTFTVGLGGDELGYWVPLQEVKLRCAADLLGPAGACQRAFGAGVIDSIDGVSGVVCKKITDDPTSLSSADPELAKVAIDSCRYGQALGRELGEPPGHYEETNSAGWDLVDDTWKAAVLLFGRDDPTQINPNNPGYTPENPPPA